jgi:hypothetical protein
VKIPACPVCKSTLQYTDAVWEEMTESYVNVRCTGCPAVIGLTRYEEGKNPCRDGAEVSANVCSTNRVISEWPATSDRLISIRLPEAMLQDVERMLGEHHGEPGIDEIVWGANGSFNKIGFHPSEQTMAVLHSVIDTLVRAWKRGYVDDVPATRLHKVEYEIGRTMSIISNLLQSCPVRESDGATALSARAEVEKHLHAYLDGRTFSQKGFKYGEPSTP